MGEEDALQPPPIQTFEPLDLTEVDARNKTLFEECSAKIGAGDGGEDLDDSKRQEIRKSVRSILVQELLDCGSGDEFGAEGAPRFRIRLQFHGSRHAAPSGETGGFRGVAKRILDGVIHRPRAVAAALEALIEDGELVLAPGGTSYTSEDKHDARYDAGSLLEAVKELRTTRVQARNAAALSLAAKASSGIVQALLHDPASGYAIDDTACPVVPRNRFEPGRMCRLGYDCRGRPRTQGHVCYLFPTRSERELIRDVLGCLAGDGTIEVLDDQNALIPGPSVALRWQEVKGLRAARTAAVAKALEERRDARRSLVEERKGRALERVDGAGWAQTTDLFGHKGDKRAQDQALLELVSANSRNVFHAKARDALRAAGLRGALLARNVGRPQGRQGYPWQLPGRALGPRGPAVARAGFTRYQCRLLRRSRGGRES